MVSLRLVEEDANGIARHQQVLRPETPSSISDTIACNSFDLGFPAVIEAVTPVTEGNGTQDLTRFHGSSTISVDLTLLGPDKVVIYDEIRAMCHPYKRVFLYVNRPEWQSERRIRLRVSNFSFVSDRASAARWKVSLTFTAPSGRMEGATLSTKTIIGSGSGSGGGGATPTDPSQLGQGYGSLTYGSGLYGSRPAPSGG